MFKKIQTGLFFILFIMLIFLLSCGTDEEDNTGAGDVWQKTIAAGEIPIDEMSGNNMPKLQCMAIDSSDNIYLGGSTYNAGGNNTGLDWMLIKYNKSGDLLWIKKIDGNNGADEIMELAVDASDTVYAVGYGTNIDPGDASVSNKDWWIKQFDSDGNELWDYKNDFIDGDDSANAVVIDNEGKIVIGGYRANGTDEDYALMKFNSDHTMPWTVKVYDNSSDDRINALTVDSSNNIYAAGTYQFNSNKDWWLLKVNYDGSYPSVLATYGISSAGLPDEPYDIKITSNDTLIATGKGRSQTTTIANEWVIKKYSTTLTEIGSELLLGDESGEGSGGGDDKGISLWVHSDDSFSVFGVIETSEDTYTHMIKNFDTAGTLLSTDNIDTASSTDIKEYKKLVYDSSGTPFIAGYSMSFDSTGYTFNWITRRGPSR